MQVYISWSGPTSYKVSLLVRDLLRQVVPGLDVWISAEDILDGARWSADLIQILNEVSFSIVCVDPKSYLSPWLLFEVGAMAKTIGKFSIRTLWFGLSKSDRMGPLTLFSPLSIDKGDFQSLIEDINATLPRINIPRYELIANLNESWEGFNQDVSNVHPDPVDPGVTKDLGAAPPKFLEKQIEHVDEVGQNILTLISVNEGIEEHRIAATMYLTSRQVFQHLIDLEGKGLVQSNLLYGTRHWKITEKGKQYLPGVYQV